MRRHINIIVVAGLITAALGGTAAAQDMRSPDARAGARETTPATIDMRSPDARAAARDTTPTIDLRSAEAVESARQSAAEVASEAHHGALGQDVRSPVQDMRSPDGREMTSSPTFEPGTIAPSRVVQISGNGFEWGDAGIGAAAALGLIALCGGVLLLVTNRRRDRRVPRPVG